MLYDIEIEKLFNIFSFEIIKLLEFLSFINKKIEALLNLFLSTLAIAEQLGCFKTNSICSSGNFAHVHGNAHVWRQFSPPVLWGQGLSCFCCGAVYSRLAGLWVFS